MASLGPSPWESASDALVAPPAEGVRAWADTHRWLDHGKRWTTSQTPYLAAIMDAMGDPSVREVNLCFGSQCGKTESMFNFIGYIAHVLPAMMLYMSSTKELARDAGRNRIDPMVMASPVLSDIFGVLNGRSTKVGTLALGMKRFRGGGLKIASALSPSDTLSHPIPYIMCDEVDRYGPDREAIIQLAKARASTFPWSKLICTSTPYGKESLIISRVKESGDARYLIPCPDCGEAYEWRWGHIQKPDDGPPIQLCPKCGTIIRTGGPAPLDLLARGRWSSDSGPCRGYRLSCLYSPFMTLDEMWREYDQARRSDSSLLMSTFCRDRMAREYSADDWDFEVPAAPIVTPTLAANAAPPRPPKDAVRTIGVDVQHDRFELTTLMVAPDGADWWYDEHLVIQGDTASEMMWEALYSELRGAKSTMTFIDAGDGNRTHHVLKFVEKYKGRIPLVASKGAHPWRKRDGHIARVSKGNPYDAPFVRFAAGYYKSRVQEGFTTGHYHGLESGALPVEIADPVERYYIQKLFAEREESTRNGGTKWVVLAKNNEPLDCSAMALAAFDYSQATKARKRKIDAELK